MEQEMKIKMTVDDKGILFSRDSVEYPIYDIEWELLETKDQLLSWIVQLMPKSWMNKRLMVEMIFRVLERNGWA